MDTEEGVEVVWNEVQISEKKSSKDQLVRMFDPVTFGAIKGVLKGAGSLNVLLFIVLSHINHFGRFRQFYK